MSVQMMAENPAEFNADKLAEQIMAEKGKRTIAAYMGLADELIDEFSQLTIEEMRLSVRPHNCLKCAEINNLARILKCTGESLLGNRNFGRKCMVELLQSIAGILHNTFVLAKTPAAEQPANEKDCLNEILNCNHLHFLKDLAQKYSVHLTDKEQEHFLSSMVAVWLHAEASPEEIAAFESLYLRSEQCTETLQKQILRNIKAAGPLGLVEDAMAQAFPDALQDKLGALLEQMQADGTLCHTKGRFFANCETLREWLEKSLEEKKANCVKKRLQGATLQELAEEMGLTRERVRQICGKIFRKLKDENPNLIENVYVPLYEKYDISADEIRVLFSESAITAGYLFHCFINGDLPLEEAVNDETLPQDMRRIIADYLTETENTITLDGKKYPLDRHVLMEYVLENYCADATDIDEFFRLYNGFLQEHGIDNADLCISVDKDRYYTVNLPNSHKLLWSLNQRLRFYDIDKNDYTKLLQQLQLNTYQNVEISTRLLIRLHPELMHEYDIRDEYELHNLLKKIHAETENNSLEFSRMPMLRFGNFDRDLFVLNVLLDYAPCDKETLIKEIEIRTGVLPETIGAVWLAGINDYYHMGVYSIDNFAMPTHMIKTLQNFLYDDAYTIDEFRTIYHRLFREADERYLNPYSLKQLGFKVYSKMVIANAESANEYFTRKLTAKDVVDFSELQRRFGGISTFSSLLGKLKDDYDVIEFAPNQLIQIRKLRSFGIDKKQLHAFCDTVAKATKVDEFFSMKMLRNSGMEFELDTLGFEDMFFESLLKEDARFRYGKFGGCVIFCQTEDEDYSMLTRGDLLKWMMRDCDSMDIYDLMDVLQAKYGCVMDRDDIKVACEQSGLYWDSIMEKVYIDYESYYREV